MKKKILPSLLLILISLISCNTTEPPPPKEDNRKLTLTFEDASCTEAWITLKTENLQLPAEINLTTTDPGGDFKSQISILSTKDSLFYIDSLLPNKTYKFHTAIQSSSHIDEVKSNELTVTTMDTTSHNFTWQVETFGVKTSTLFDVAIVDENNIWCVGEIYLNDSTGQPDPNAYNLVHWDGIEWKLSRLQFYTFCGQSHTGSYPTKSIIAFSENDIWITSGSQIAHFDGVNQLITECIPVSVNKLWGTDKNNLYAVGINGQIARYQNGLWRRVESGTDLPIQDIWGELNPITNKETILCIASDKYGIGSKQLLKINGNNVTVLPDSGLKRSLSSIWFTHNRKYFIVGNGIFEKRSIENDEVWYLYPYGEITNYYSNSLRGNGFNDIVIAGGDGSISHFNGTSWKEFQELINPLDDLFSVSIKGNMIVAVGERYYDGVLRYGVIYIGRR